MLTAAVFTRLPNGGQFFQFSHTYALQAVHILKKSLPYELTFKS